MKIRNAVTFYVEKSQRQTGNIGLGFRRFPEVLEKYFLENDEPSKMIVNFLTHT